METRALISDIHGNIEALKVVMDHIKSQGITKVLCLGDVVGYGPNPDQCMDVVKDCEFILMGNHEEAVLYGAFGFNPSAKEAVEWTRQQLMPGVLSSRAKKERWKILQNLPLTVRERNILYVHGSPRDPTMEYILKSDCEDLFGEIPEKIREIFSMIDGLCFVGHTHNPGIITEEGKFISPHDTNYLFRYDAKKKYIVNIGSVGQPRDKDPRACYVTFNSHEIRWHRLEYNHRAVMKKILSIPQLDNRNAERLETGT